MNETLQKIIHEFQAKVEIANELLKQHLNTQEPHNWHTHIEQAGLLDGKFKYFFHGVGCAVHLSETDVVDFDYGSNGRIDGFDDWRLGAFVEKRKEQFPSVTPEDIKHWLADALALGEIERPSSEMYGNLFYFTKST